MAKQNTKATAGKPTVTYKGVNDSIDYLGYRMVKGQAVEVDEKTAQHLLGNSFFEVSGVEQEPTKFATADEALDAERARHAEELADLTKQHSEEMERQAESLKAGWKQQHDAMQARIEELEAAAAGNKA